MELAQIPETESWLEEDSESSEGLSLDYKKHHQEDQTKKPDKMNLTSKVTTVAKISIYSYLVFKIFSQSTVSKYLIKYLKNLPSKYQSVAMIVSIVFITFLNQLKS
jgi:hypothetical protein